MGAAELRGKAAGELGNLGRSFPGLGRYYAKQFPKEFNHSEQKFIRGALREIPKGHVPKHKIGSRDFERFRFVRELRREVQVENTSRYM